MENLLHRLAQSQEEKWDLEAQLRDCQVSIGELTAALAKSRQVVRMWAMERKAGGRRDQARDSAASSSSVPEALRQEVTQKLEAVLEDALLENIQLKNDINVVATELEELKKQK